MSHRHFPFVVLEIEAQNLERAGAFYSTLFGWSFAESAIEPGALEADLGADQDTVVRVHLRPHDASVGGLRRHARSHSVCVDDLTPILASLVAAGGQLIAGPLEVPGVGLRLHVRDTEGNDVAILEPLHQQR